MKITDFKIVAVSGENTYLLLMPDGKHARVLSLDSYTFTKPMPQESYLKRGYWTKYQGEQSKIEELYKQYLENIETDRKSEEEINAIF